ncbi:MAG: hypothetical protein ACLSAC_13730 [Enterocloster bolteae]|uniref:hypothetical protein n=1 Tax=Enterocloster bolteae TaxID=208479 RepID=UPI00206A2CD8|nr:hypothetical protein [Enterocloster bolteae]DAL64406.1 MAG TPA_asm: Radical SAM superfamily [Caudoviricetes sp.]
MNHSRLSRKDPVYYKCTMMGLLSEARENGLRISIGTDGQKTKLYFRSPYTGECAGAVLIEKDEEQESVKGCSGECDYCGDAEACEQSGYCKEAEG